MRGEEEETEAAPQATKSPVCAVHIERLCVPGMHTEYREYIPINNTGESVSFTEK